MALSRTELRAGWRERQARRRKKLRALVSAILPDDHCARCKVHDVPLELAHLEPTGLRGRSRGSSEVLKDVLANPSSYARLCLPCHRGLDADDHGIELDEAPF